MNRHLEDLSMMDAVLVTDLDGTIISIHEKLMAHTNKTVQQVKGEKIKDIFGPDFQGLPKKTLIVSVGNYKYKIYLEKFKEIKSHKLDTYSKYFNLILDSIYEGVTIIDSNRNIIYANKKACELMGTRIQSKNMLVYYAEEISDISILDTVLRTGRPFTAINTFRNGLSSLTTGIPIFDEETNELKFAVSVARNITELVTKQNAIGSKDKKTPFPATRFLSKSKKLIYVLSKIDTLTNPNLSILITGETGTGKDYFARMMHQYFYKGDPHSPFVRVNCGAIPENLLESELFGYEKGAFTGASDVGKKGLIELANNGIFFLDEIGELPYRLQTKLLGVLQDRELVRVGGHKRIKITAKFVCATNADLPKMIKNNQFRLDLYYRISLITIKMPPLRERIEDIPYLVESILNEANKKYDKNSYLSLELINIFLRYRWPGNIRELKNIVEKLVVFAENERIEVDDLVAVSEFLGGDFESQLSKLALDSKDKKKRKGLKDFMENYERTFIEQVLKKSDTLKKAAEILQIDISTLVRKKRKYSI